jgi:hypothetical protein
MAIHHPTDYDSRVIPGLNVIHHNNLVAEINDISQDGGYEPFFVSHQYYTDNLHGYPE